MRTSLLVTLFLLTASASAQTTAEILYNGRCRLADIDQSLNEPYVAVNTLGIELDREGFPVTEAQAVNVYIIGKASATSLIDVRRTSTIRNLDQINLAGARTTDMEELAEDVERVLNQLEAEPCIADRRVVTDFAPPVGTVGLTVYDTSTATTRKLGTDIGFAIRTLYRGGVTFGPVASCIPELGYKTVADSTGGFVLAETGGDLDMEYAIGFEYYIGGPRTRDESGVGVFMAIPITDRLGDDAVAGLSANLGTLFVAQLGLRLGKVGRIVAEQEGYIGEPVAEDFSATIQSVWRVGPVVGIALDAGAAAQAFGKIFTSIANP